VSVSYTARVRLAPFAILTACTATLLAVPRQGGQSPAARPAVLAKFLTFPSKPLMSYRAKRHLEAHNLRFKKDGWMDVVTTLSPELGFAYTVVAEGGSDYVRRRALYGALDGERDAVKEGRQAVVITDANYTFADPVNVDGLAHVRLTPRRKDKLLVDGWIFLRPEDGNLMELNGRLAKSPSWWVNQVQIVRRYQLMGDVRVPIELQSVADVKIAGRSTFAMTYTYEMVNGKQISPK
jgi:hypothetical protein